MDHDLIYAKTASGEAAMLQRTRVMQRNVRMVLILVDSQSSVADLCLKTGNPQLTESALLELEKGGFVEPRGAQDSMWAEGTKVAQEVRAAANSHRKLAQTASGAVTAPSRSDVALSAGAVIKTAAPSDWSTAKTSVPLVQAEQASLAAGAEVETENSADAPALPSGATAPSLVERIKAYFIRRELNDDQPILHESLRLVSGGEDRSEAESGIRLADRVKAAVPCEIGKGGEVIRIKPIKRAQTESIGWPAIIVLGISGALALGFLTVLLFPYNSYLPELEMAIANASGRPVKVGTLRLNLYPRPSILLGEVRIGEGTDEINIDEIRLQPAIGTLMAAKKSFRELIVSGASLPAEAIAGLPAVFVALSKADNRFAVDRFSFEKAEVTFAGLGFSNLDGEATLSADGLLQSLLLQTADRRLSLAATPRAPGLEVVLEGYGWRAVAGSAFLFDSLNLNAAFENGALTIKSMALRIFDGLIEGGAVLRADQAPSIVGELSFKRVNATRFGEAIGLGQQFSGETAGKIRFSTKAKSWESIFSAIDADGDFTVQRGSVRGIDLAEAARSVSRTPIQGGVTQFESLSGTIKLMPARYQFSGLVLNSGLMQSTGYLEVSRELLASGKMELKIRGTANQTRVPISISGPLKSPIVQVGHGR